MRFVRSLTVARSEILEFLRLWRLGPIPAIHSRISS